MADEKKKQAKKDKQVRRNRSAPSRCLAKKRELEALDLRLKGHSQVAIAERLGMTTQGVSQAIHRALDRQDDTLAERSAQVRELCAARLEGLIEAHSRKAFSGRSLDTADAVAKWTMAIAKLYQCVSPNRNVLNVGIVNGADTQAEVSVAEATPKFLARLESSVIVDGDPGDIQRLGSRGEIVAGEIVAPTGAGRTNTK